MSKSKLKQLGLPETAKKLDRPILAEGEVTGHFHEAIGEGAAVYDIGGGVAVLDAPTGATITHQEHKPIEVPKGDYERRLVQEFDPLEQEARAVRD